MMMKKKMKRNKCLGCFGGVLVGVVEMFPQLLDVEVQRVEETARKV